MMAPPSDVHYSDDQVTLFRGDALNVLRSLPDNSANCVVTSPPYYGLRDYDEPGQYGLEPSPEQYVQTMRAVFTETRRVLADDGTLWLNLGDSYSATTKDLAGIPWRVAFALQRDGWILRNAAVWSKPNGMPASVADRFASRYENVFLLAQTRRYWFDLDAVRVPYAESTINHAPRRDFIRKDSTAAHFGNPQRGLDRQPHFDQERAGRNPGDVWEIPTQPFPGAHFAVMPPALAERCILAGCRPGGVVLDPFCGSGTTGMVALRHGRRFTGIDLSANFLDLALRSRLAQGALIETAGP